MTVTLSILSRNKEQSRIILRSTVLCSLLFTVKPKQGAHHASRRSDVAADVYGECLAALFPNGSLVQYLRAAHDPRSRGRVARVGSGRQCVYRCAGRSVLRERGLWPPRNCRSGGGPNAGYLVRLPVLLPQSPADQAG